MNVALLKKVRKHILEEPRRFVMRTWVLTKKSYGEAYFPDKGPKVKFAKCGIAACIGGWACILADNANLNELKFADVRSRAGELLGFDGEDQYILFAHLGWPNRYRAAYMKETTTTGRAKVAARAINNFIKTDGWRK